MSDVRRSAVNWLPRSYQKSLSRRRRAPRDLVAAAVRSYVWNVATEVAGDK